MVLALRDNRYSLRIRCKVTRVRKEEEEEEVVKRNVSIGFINTFQLASLKLFIETLLSSSFSFHHHQQTPKTPNFVIR